MQIILRARFPGAEHGRASGIKPLRGPNFCKPLRGPDSCEPLRSPGGFKPIRTPGGFKPLPRGGQRVAATRARHQGPARHHAVRAAKVHAHDAGGMEIILSLQHLRWVFFILFFSPSPRIL